MELSNRQKKEQIFCKHLTNKGFDFATGVPCGVQKFIISDLSQDSKVVHVPAVRESEAIGLAAGAYLSGKRPLVYMQNSGFLNSINDVTSLLMTYGIPVLFLVSWRGAPGEDACQHYINGQITCPILNELSIHWEVLEGNYVEVIDRACNAIKKGNLSVILIKRDHI